MRGKAPDVLIHQRITDFSTTGSAGLKRRNNGNNMFTLKHIEQINMRVLTATQTFV